MQKYGRGKLEQYYTAIKIHLTKFLFRRRSFLKESEEPSIKWIATYDGSHESAFKDNSKPGRLWREKLKTLQVNDLINFNGRPYKIINIYINFRIAHRKWYCEDFLHNVMSDLKREVADEISEEHTFF